MSYVSCGPFVTGSALRSPADCDAFFHLRCDRDAGESTGVGFAVEQMP